MGIRDFSKVIKRELEELRQELIEEERRRIEKLRAKRAKRAAEEEESEEDSEDSYIEIDMSQWDPVESYSSKMFKGKRIAIDMGNFMYVCYYEAMGYVIGEMGDEVLERDPTPDEILPFWVQVSVKNLKNWLRAGIVPVLVWDGPPPEEKKDTRSKRAEEAQKRQLKIDSLRKEIEEYGSSTDRCNKLTAAMKSNNLIDRGISEIYEEIISALGIPSMKSLMEADQLCTSLCGCEELGWYGKYVEGIYSRDSDLILGCPVLIKEAKPTKSRRTMTFTCLIKTKLLELLELDSGELLELCITLGCDYNERIRLIGPVKAMKLIRDHECIANFPERINTECLNEEACKRLFAYRNWEDVTDFDSVATRVLDFEPTWNDNLSEVLESYDIRIDMEELYKIFVKMGYVREEDYDSGAPPALKIEE
uniref:XPG-I domain-containing protein n=1 Tax=viral metagenome TaxID=1070528 RepID=A0A6C0JSG5_9ZZZZ